MLKLIEKPNENLPPVITSILKEIATSLKFLNRGVESSIFRTIRVTHSHVIAVKKINKYVLIKQPIKKSVYLYTKFNLMRTYNRKSLFEKSWRFVRLNKLIDLGTYTENQITSIKRFPDLYTYSIIISIK